MSVGTQEKPDHKELPQAPSLRGKHRGCKGNSAKGDQKKVLLMEHLLRDQEGKGSKVQRKGQRHEAGKLQKRCFLKLGGCSDLGHS